MNFSAAQIAEILGGRVEGDESVEVNKLSKIEEGVSKSLTFLANPKYTPYIYETDASIVIVQDDFQAERPIKDTCTLIRVPDAYSSFGKLLELYDQMRHTKEGIEKGAVISEKADVDASVFVGSNTFIGDHVKIAKNCKIYNGCYIADGTSIEENTILYPGVRIYHDCVIGKNCVFHAGVIIGSDGFGFSPTSENNYAKLPQIGNVLIEDDVEIGSNSCIDRATMGSTIIHKGVKIDNLVQIGHNAEVGEHTVIVAQTGIAGSSKIGKNCMIGGQVGIAGHLTIGDNVKIAAQSGIGNNVEDGAVIQGSPAFAIGDYQRAYVGFRRLPRLMKVLDRIQKDLKKLTESNE